MRLLAPLMSRDDEGAPEDAVVPTFEKKMVAESFPGVDIKALFDRASEQSFDVAPAPMETDVTLDAAAAKSWQNALRALIDVVSQVAPHIANKTGDPLQELFKHMCEASAFQQYLGAPRVAPDGEQLPALELTVDALMAANNDPQKRCFAGGHNANVVKKHADNLAKALRLLVNALQKGGGLVDTDSWLDNVRRSTANLKDDRTGNKVAIRFATVFPKALNTWPACLQHLLAVVDKHAASSVHEVSKRFKHMGATLKVAGFKASTDQKYIANKAGRAKTLAPIKWLWQIYASVNHNPTPQGFIDTLLDPPPATDGPVPLTFGECLVRAYMCWISRACLLLCAEDAKPDGVLPHHPIEAGETAAARPCASTNHCNWSTRWSTSASGSLAGRRQLAAAPGRGHACDRRAATGLCPLDLVRRHLEGRHSVGLRVGYVEHCVATRAHRQTLGPEHWDGSPELRRGLWFVHWPSAGISDEYSNIQLQYNDGKTCGADTTAREDKFKRNAVTTEIRRAGKWRCPEYSGWLPLFLDAYYVICGRAPVYTANAKRKTQLNMFAEVQCKNFHTPAMRLYNRFFAKLKQSKRQATVDYRALHERQTSGWTAGPRTEDYQPAVDAMAKKGVAMTKCPPRDHAYDLTPSTAQYNCVTSRWMESAVIDICKQIVGGQSVTMRPFRWPVTNRNATGICRTSTSRSTRRKRVPAATTKQDTYTFEGLPTCWDIPSTNHNRTVRHGTTGGWPAVADHQSGGTFRAVPVCRLWVASTTSRSSSAGTTMLTIPGSTRRRPASKTTSTNWTTR